MKKDDITKLNGLPLLSQNYFFVFGKQAGGLAQGDKVKVRFDDYPWLLAIIVGIRGIFNIIVTIDLVFAESESAITAAMKNSCGFEFKFIERGDSDIDFNRSVSADKFMEILNYV